MFKSYQQILDELLAALPANLTDKQSGSLTYTLMAVIARALRVVWFMLEQLLNLFFVSTSKGSYLVRRAAERGVIQKPGTNATGNVLLTRTTPAPVGATLTAGTRFATLDGKIEFTTQQDVALPTGWTGITAQVECSTVGASGNLAAGTALQIVGAQVVGVQNIAVDAAGFSGGTDQETDDELRDRYLFTIQNPQNGGTPADYVVWAESVTGVKSAICLPKNRGNGTVDVVITDGGIPSDELVTQVSDFIQTLRPVGADVQVLKPTAHAIDITGTITAAQGYTTAGLTPLVQTALTNYLASVPIGGVVRLSGIIGAAMGVQGVLDFTVSVPADNIYLGTTEMSVAGTITIS